jgi:hypothetical protein
MFKYILLAGMLMLTYCCGTYVVSEQGKNGKDAPKLLMDMYRVTTNFETCRSLQALIIENGVDENHNNILDQEEIDNTGYICDGADGEAGEDGLNSIVELIDPCGNGAGYDEVLLRLSDGSLLCYFESGTNRFLSVIGEGYYRTTDVQQCYFHIDANNNITY